MIKKMYLLTLNELIKEYKKKTVVIISILILLSAFFVPFAVKAIEHSANSFNASMQDSNVSYLESALKNLDASASGGKIQKAILESELTQAKLNKEYNIGFEGWKSIDSQKYLDTLLSMDILNLRKANISIDDILGNPYLNNVPLAKELAALPKAEINSSLAKLTTQSEKLLSNIKTDNYLGYVSEEISINKSSVSSMNKYVAELEKKAKTNPNNLELQKDVTEQKNQLASTNEYLKTLEFRYNNKIPFDTKNWKSQTLTAMQETIAIANTPIMTEAQFMAKPIPKLTYSQYKTKKELLKTTAENQLKKDWYSLNNNIPQSQYATNAQSVVDSFVGIYSIVITLFIIIIAGGIVSSEFSRNTIKLLLVRPASRFKVLLSKLISIYIIGYVLFFLSMIIILVMSGFIFGFNGIASPILKVSGGIVHTQAYIIFFILHILFCSISLLCAGALSFMLSTVTKSTAVSVATSIILYIGLPIVTAIMLAKDYYWFTCTPFAYFNIPGAMIIKGMIDVPSFNSYSIMHLNLGGLEIIILALIFIIISFAKFIKSDIR